jgi:hypothetical protein
MTTSDMRNPTSQAIVVNAGKADRRALNTDSLTVAVPYRHHLVVRGNWIPI